MKRASTPFFMSWGMVLYTSRMLRTASLLLALPFLFVLIPTSASAFTCADGTESHAAKAGEVPGVPEGTQTCTQTTILNGGCDFNPYPILDAFRTGGNVQVTPSGVSSNLQNGINPA